MTSQPQPQLRSRRVAVLDWTKPAPIAPTFREHVAATVRRHVGRWIFLFAVPAVVFFAAVPGVDFGVSDITFATPEEGAGGDVVDTPAERLLAEHADECWQAGDKPLADLPSAAIIRYTVGPMTGDVVWTDLFIDVSDAFGETLARMGLEGENIEESRRLDVVALCVLPDQAAAA